MEKSDRRPVPACILAHELINKLSTIIGNCDLVSEMAPVDSEGAKRLSVIRETARGMAVELNKRQCELNVLLRTNHTENGKFLNG